MDVYSGKIANNDDKTGRQGGPLPGLLRPPLVFLFAILLGILLNWARSFHFVPPTLKLLGPFLLLSPYCSSCFPFGNFAEPALPFGEASARPQSCAPVLTGSVAIPR